LTKEAFESAPRKLREVYDAALADDELVIVDSTISLEQAVFAYCRRLKNATFGGDARGLAGFTRRFEESIAAYKAVPQNWELRASLEYTNGLAADRRIHHTGQPLLSYNVANVVYENGKMMKYDATSSGIGSGKTDGCMAMLSAIQIAESQPTWDVAGMIG
jgi:phage terminase large subunit-like protein